MATSLRGHRAKLYRLSEQDAWVDHGVGLVRCERLDVANVTLIVLESEAPGADGRSPAILLETRVTSGEITYKRTANTIIAWTLDNVESALSFENEEGCNQVWEEVCNVQGVGSQDSADSLLDGPPLPAFARENLPAIAEVLSTPFRPRFATALVEEGGLAKVRGPRGWQLCGPDGTHSWTAGGNVRRV
jgi:hypothetical protein